VQYLFNLHTLIRVRQGPTENIWSLLQRVF